MHIAINIILGIITEDVRSASPVSFWPFFSLSLVTVPVCVNQLTLISFFVFAVEKLGLCGIFHCIHHEF